MNTENLNWFLQQIEEKYYMSGWLTGDIRKIKIKEITEEIKNYLKGAGNKTDKIEIAKVWSYFFINSNESWLHVLAIFYFKKISSKRDGEIVQYWGLLKNWIIKLDNWGFADMTSSIYSQIVEDDPELIYPTLVKWSENESPWYRRIAIVSLIYYYRCRKKFLPFKKIIRLVEPQMEIDHYYLQKGVGWALKELTQAYPLETFYFMMNNADKIKSTAFSAAIEKIPTEQKEKLKALRKEIRRQKV